MVYSDDFYDDPSEFEMQVEEFKESLAKAVKSEFLGKMEKLENENAELRAVKESFDRIKAECEEKKRECDKVMREAEDRACHMRVDELLERFKVIFWRPDWDYLYGPKCDKCDASRTIDVILPSGNRVKDRCECFKVRRKVAFPRKMILCELSDSNYEIRAWYCAHGCGNERRYDLVYSGNVSEGGNFVEPGTDFELLAREEASLRLLFATGEECLAYCKYLNEKNGVSEDIVYESNGKKSDVLDEWRK